MEKKKVLNVAAIALAGVIAGGVAGGIIGYNMAESGAGAQLEQIFDHNDQLSFGNFFGGNGLSLTAYADEVATASTGQVFPTVVADVGESFSLQTINNSSAPFTYQMLTYFENSIVTRIGVPVLSVDDYTAVSTFTLSVVSYDSTPTFTKVSEQKLTIPANTFSSNTVNQWYYWDVNVSVGSNQTLAFLATTDSVKIGYRAAATPQYLLRNRLFGDTTASDKNCLYIDVYTSEEAPPSEPVAGVQRLTATVTPANAVNAVLDWNVSWKNASSTWASGKTVTDYVTVTPTSDGALTADVECKQAFGEQVIVTANVRGYADIKATCTVDYVQKETSSSFNLNHYLVSGERNLIDWTFNSANSEALINFEDCAYEGQGWRAYMCGVDPMTGQAFADVEISREFDRTLGETYTIPINYQSSTLTISATQAYLDVLSSAGFTVTATANSPVTLDMEEFNASLWLLESFTSNKYVNNMNQYSTWRSELLANVDDVMFEVTLTNTYSRDNFGFLTLENQTTWQVKFSPESVQAIVLEVDLNDSSLEF